jgi:arylsulfatase A-like enzyme
MTNLKGCYLLALLFFCSLMATAQAPERPNFIILLADDLGYGDLSCTGSTQIQTPNIDRIARQGVTFENGYVSAPVCSPSRAGLLTGRNQVAFGHDNNIDYNQPGFDPHFLGLPVTEKTIADYLHELGYLNALIGKWHLGEASHFHPLKRGFHRFWGFTNGGHDYLKTKAGDTGYQRPIESSYPADTSISYLTDDIGRECVRVIEETNGLPFFLMASFNAPHTPLQALPKDLELFKAIADEDRRTYAAMVHRLDQNVGQILKVLEKKGISDQTVVVFLSDNGGPVRNNASVNAPFYGQKGTLFEGGIHVPFFILWPGKIRPGTSFKHPVLSLDILPTFLSAAGGTPDPEAPADGVDLMPYLNGQKTGRPHDEMKWRFTIGAAIRVRDYKLIRLPDRLPMLFDLEQDPSEQQELSGAAPEETIRLLKKLGEWDISLPHPLFLEGARWKAHNLRRYDMSYDIEQPKGSND